jgi:hypothetical protein
MQHEHEKKTVADFLTQYFALDLHISSGQDADKDVIEEVLSYVANRFGRMKYILGLALDFAIVAQLLSDIDESGKPFRRGLTEKKLFARYHRITARGNTKANTLTFEYGGSKVGIRKIEEDVCKLFARLNSVSRSQ